MAKKKLLRELEKIIETTKVQLKQPEKRRVNPFGFLLVRLFEDLNAVHSCIASRQDDPDIFPIYRRTSDLLEALSRSIASFTPESADTIRKEFDLKFRSYSSFITLQLRN